MNCRTCPAYNMRMQWAAARNIRCCIVLALAAAATVAAVSTRAQPAVQPPPPPPLSSIRVTAEARVTARPDRVQIDLGVVTHAATSQEAAAENARRADAVLAAVRKALGGAGVLKT